MDNEKLQTLVDKFVGGDKAAFEEIYSETYKFVYFSCYSVLKSQEDAEEATQDVYLTIYNKLEEYRDNGKFLGWLKTVAANKSCDYLRKLNRMPEIDQFEDFNDTDYEDDNLENLPEYYIDQEEKRKIFEKIMKENLSDVQFNTLFFHYYNELPVEEIARIMKCPEGTVKTRLKKARQILKAKVAEYEEKFDVSLAAVGGVPFLTKYFTEIANACHPRTIPPFIVPGGSASGVAGAVGVAGKAAIGKIVAGSLVGATVLAVGIVAIVKDNDKQKVDETTVAVTETEAEAFSSINLNDFTSMDTKINPKSVNIKGNFDSETVNKIITENLENVGSDFDIKNYISCDEIALYNLVNGDTVEWKWTADEDALKAFESQYDIDIVYSDFVYEVQGQDFGEYDLLKNVSLKYETIDDKKASGTADYILCNNISVSKGGNCPVLPGLKIVIDGYTEEELATKTFGTGDVFNVKLQLTDTNYSSVEEYCKAKGYSSVIESTSFNIGHKEYKTTPDKVRENPKKYVGYFMEDFMKNSRKKSGPKYILLTRKEEYNDKPYYAKVKGKKLHTNDRMYIEPYLLISVAIDKADKGTVAVGIEGPFYNSFLVNWDVFDETSIKNTQKGVMKNFVKPLEKYYNIEYLN